MITPNDLIHVGIALGFILIFNKALVLECLRRRHHDTWVALGKPIIFGSMKSSREVRRFMGLRGDFRKLNDKVLNGIVFVSRILEITFFLVIAGVMLLALTGHK